MKNCPKCNSEDIKKTGHFARQVENGKTQEQGEEMVNYFCRNCDHEWKIKFREDKD